MNLYELLELMETTASCQASEAQLLARDGVDLVEIAGNANPRSSHRLG